MLTPLQLSVLLLVHREQPKQPAGEDSYSAFLWLLGQGLIEDVQRRGEKEMYVYAITPKGKALIEAVCAPTPGQGNRLTLNGAQLAEALLLLDGDMYATLTLVEREAFTNDTDEDMPAGIYALDNNHPDEGLYGPLNELNPLCP